MANWPSTLAKPWIDRLLYPEDREEIAWIQTLDRRLLTSSDLRQFLTNVLIGLCELLRVPNGFVLVQTDDGLRVEAVAGEAADGRGAFITSERCDRCVWQQFARGQHGGGANGDRRYGNGEAESTF